MVVDGIKGDGVGDSVVDVMEADCGKMDGIDFR